MTCTTSLSYDFGFADVDGFEYDMLMIARASGCINMINRYIGRWFFARGAGQPRYRLAILEYASVRSASEPIGTSVSEFHYTKTTWVSVDLHLTVQACPGLLDKNDVDPIPPA
ncbi:uncharacterized protein CLUP02_00337 [Colletotrichum lupini]|uniref:Uncharacterized protein n=1 Tax=Colletotrichum lupini TaxID=145971 RepID=A0A9Q8SB76_9PEZI|nr:uncharacterized protein CLUP02_00337 [Colletotrichum lupini]UQC73691.1 hypothetical protein CLUP02_00337 [Colletotrichum lupini]